MQVLWANTVERLTVNDLIDILIVTFMIYNLLLLTRETKANQVIKGVGILFLAYWISDLLGGALPAGTAPRTGKDRP